MGDLKSLLPLVLADRYQAHATRIQELAEPLSEEQFWKKPFSFGNSFGHLVLHLTGNLSFYVGAQIAKTGYVRDRPKEFADSNPPSKAETLKRINDAVGMVVRTVKSQSLDDWTTEYSGMGTDARDRLTIFLICESHMQLHIGQMIYLVKEIQRPNGLKAPLSSMLALVISECRLTIENLLVRPFFNRQSAIAQSPRDIHSRRL